MGIGMTVAEALRKDGHDCVHLLEQGLERIADHQVLEKAREECRTVLTHDLDFSRLLALSSASSPSVVTFRLDDMRPQSVLTHLRHLISQYGDDIEKGAAIVVNNLSVRRRQLPIVPPLR